MLFMFTLVLELLNWNVFILRVLIVLFLSVLALIARLAKILRARAGLLLPKNASRTQQNAQHKLFLSSARASR